VVDGYETDLQVTSDGIVILMHDLTLERTTNGTGYVRLRPFSYIQTLDAGTKQIGKYAAVPTLEGALRLVQGTNKLVVMDLKTEGLGVFIGPILDRLNVHTNVIASCWTMTCLQDMKLHTPKVPLQFLNDGSAIPSLPADWPAFFSYLRANFSVNGFSLGYNRLLAAPTFVTDARRKVFSVVTWTVNSPSDIVAITTAGVDGIITDDPLGVRAQLNALNLPVGADIQMTRGGLAVLVIFTFAGAFVVGAFALNAYIKRRKGVATAYDTINGII